MQQANSKGEPLPLRSFSHGDLSGHKMSEDKSFKGRDAVVGKGQEMSFWKSSQSRGHSCCQHQVQRGFHLRWWGPGARLSQYSRLICLEALSLMELTW